MKREKWEERLEAVKQIILTHTTRTQLLQTWNQNELCGFVS